MFSASPIGGVTVGAQEQGNMKVRLSLSHGKCYLNDGIQRLDFLPREIPRGVEAEAVESGRQSAACLWLQFIASAITVGAGGNKQPPFAGRFPALEMHEHTSRRLA